SEKSTLHGAKYLLTFRPFSQLPAAVQRAHLERKLHLLPFPGSLLFWGSPLYIQLQKELPTGLQIPLLHAVSRNKGGRAMRVPQAGWLHEPQPERRGPDGHYGPVRNTYRRTHRWSKIHRDEDELAVDAREDHLMHVLFSTALDDLWLYGKPIARNGQIWDENFHLLFHCPKAERDEIGPVQHLLHACDFV